MILVTGATGFIGRRFIKKLVEEEGKENILCLAYNRTESELEKSGRAILDGLGVKYIPIDLITAEGMHDLPRNPEKVFHLASVTDTGAPDHRVNDLGTKNLIEALGPLSAKTRFVFTSTIALHDNRTDYKVPITEELPAPARPCNEYGRRKLKTVEYLKDQAKKQGFSLAIVRVCGVYGEGTRKGGLFQMIEESVKKEKFLSRVPFPGKISLMHVEDMANLLCRASAVPVSPGQAQEAIASVEALSFAEMCEALCGAYHKKYRALPVPGFLWGMLRFFARKKGMFEAVTPHALYNRLWQLFLLCNNEFWNESKKMWEWIPGWKPLKFEQYYQRKAAEGLPEKQRAVYAAT